MNPYPLNDNSRYQRNFRSVESISRRQRHQPDRQTSNQPAVFSRNNRGRAALWVGERLENDVLTGFNGRVLFFDLEATTAYARLISQARRAGHPIATADGYIAAIAKAHGHSIASRDTAPFDAAGVSVINPWQS